MRVPSSAVVPRPRCSSGTTISRPLTRFMQKQRRRRNTSSAMQTLSQEQPNEPEPVSPSTAVPHLTAHPSRSFTLRNLGSKLPDWLAINPNFAGRRHRLAVDVARIEWAFIEAFDNADRTPLTLDQVATLDANTGLALQPHLRLIALDYPADDLVLNLHNREKRQTSEAGVKHEDATGTPAKLPRLRRLPTWLAAHRVDLTVFYRRLQPEEFLTLAAIRQGLPLAEAIAAGFAGSRISESHRAKSVSQWFANWAELGWICAPELESLL